MTARERAARWLWVVPSVAFAAYAVLNPPTITLVTALAAVFVLVMSLAVLDRRPQSDVEQERGMVLDLDELAVVAFALVADPVLVGATYAAMARPTPTARRYRWAYTVTMRAVLGLAAALVGQLVLASSVESEPVRSLLFVGAAAAAHLILTVGTTVATTVAIWVESGELLDHWYMINTADLALAGMAIPLGALGADLLERSPYGALLLGVVVVGAAIVLTRLLAAEMAVRDEQHRREELLGRLAELADIERRELVRQVHDGPLQQLILARMLVDQARSAGPVTDQFDDIDTELGRSVSELRRVLSGSDSSLVIHGLGPAIESLVGSTFVPDSTTVRVIDDLPPGFDVAGSVNAAGTEVALACVRELLHNALKHASATEICIEVAVRDDQLVASVTDDGIGFDPALVLPQREREGHLGIPILHERLEKVGGHIVFDSQPGRGARGTCTVPQAGATSLSPTRHR